MITFIFDCARQIIGAGLLNDFLGIGVSVGLIRLVYVFVRRD